MKQLHLIGDSISINYEPHLLRLLAPEWHITHKDEAQSDKKPDFPAGRNNGNSRQALAYVYTLVKNDLFYPDFLLMNCGLHDIKRTYGILSVPLEEYYGNVCKMLELLLCRNIPCAMITSTPVDDELHATKMQTFERKNQDLLACNSALYKVALEKRVPLIDLYAFTRPKGAGAYCDHVHFTEDIQREQAAFLAAALESMGLLRL